MRRIVHRTRTMIACLIDGRVLLLDTDDFSSLIGRLMTDMDLLDQFYFKLAVFENVGYGLLFDATDIMRKNMEWERDFSDRLKEEIAHGKFDPCYVFEVDESQMHIDDYLEAFRSSFRYIDVELALTHNRQDVLYKVSLRSKQSLVDIALHRYGKSVGEWNFLRSEVTRIVGSSLNFVVTIGGLHYAFTPDGVHRQ